MYHRLLLITVLCSFFTTVLSVQCYEGTDTQCMLLPNMKDCGVGKQCHCARYRFTCTAYDQACNENETRNHAKKWVYTVTTKDACKAWKKSPMAYEKVKCCKRNKCNKPVTSKCT